ncbi:hypothetical protein Ciccas_002153 [Cichlidogyrus casuarinus]|uniref:Uncharacterized protein n=1 Tax=Cichlidogyrus casuarinus TaxID=1844966 RepID=A0ABD2QI17_9PLAT
MFPNIREKEKQEFQQNPNSGVQLNAENVENFAKFFKESLKNNDSFIEFKEKFRTTLSEIPKQYQSGTEIKEILKRLDELKRPTKDVLQEWVEKCALATDKLRKKRAVPQLKKLSTLREDTDVMSAFEFKSDDEEGLFEATKQISFPNNYEKNASIMYGTADSLDSYASVWSHPMSDGEQTDEDTASIFTFKTAVKTKTKSKKRAQSRAHKTRSMQSRKKRGKRNR